MYEYVNRSEYQPVRPKLEDIIRKVYYYMRKEYDLTFQHKLIGSGSRHLVTRIKGGNKGFDFDYNFIIPHPGEGYHWKADVIKSATCYCNLRKRIFDSRMKSGDYSFAEKIHYYVLTRE